MINKCKYYDKNGTCFCTKGKEITLCKGDITECERNNINGHTYTPEQQMIITFKKNLKKALKDIIIDSSKIYVIDDTLHVEFYYHQNVNYIYTELSITSKIVSGLTTEELANKICNAYKSVILIRHFKKKF